MDAGPRRRALIVDDNRMDTGLLHAVLMQAGIEATVVHDVPAAIALAGVAAAFDMIVIDWRIPGISGPDLASSFLAMDSVPRPLLVVLSSAVPPAARRDLESLGVLVRPKPVDLEGYERLGEELAGRIGAVAD